MNPVLRAALDYAARGWCVLPMRMAEKRPAVAWKRYQRSPPSDSTLRRWFGDGAYGVGVVFGSVSGGLASRDFDDLESYQRWAAAWPVLARTLPTVATRRGRHVYCRLWPESVIEARGALGKPVEGRGAIAFGDGELRAGVGCYSVLPPSTHPSGHVYGWTVPLPAIGEDLPTLNACDCGFVPIDANAYAESLRQTCNTENTSNRRAWVVDGLCGAEAVFGSLPPDDDGNPPAAGPARVLTVEEAVAGALPTGRGQRHRLVFELARRLKATELADREASDLREVVRDWHRRALPFIGTRAFDETWIDFLKAWPNVRTPFGVTTTVDGAFEAACRAGLPAIADRYDQAEVGLLAGLCRELQRAAGDRPFYLSCRDAGRLLGVSHVQASRWLFLLCADGVIEVVERGTRKTRHATTYRYAG